jgi:hypothetical protein
MKTMSLFEKRPEVLADQSNPQEMIAQLRDLADINTEQQETLDWVLTDWVMMMLSRPADVEGVVEMHKLCRLAQSSLDESESAPNFRQRWAGYADLLEAKRLALRARTSPQSLELLQEPRILAELAQGEVKQANFTDILNLSAGRVSQVLAVLESRGRITRTRRGKESWVSLMLTKTTGVADTAPPVLRLSAESPKVPYRYAPPARIGASFLAGL